MAQIVLGGHSFHMDIQLFFLAFAKNKKKQKTILSLLREPLSIKSIDHLFVGSFLDSLFSSMDLCLYLFLYHTVSIFVVLG